MPQNKKSHQTLRGEVISLEGLDRKEKIFFQEVLTFYSSKPDWTEFGGFWLAKVLDLYQPHRLTRPQIRKKPLYRVAQDLGSRLAVMQGHARLPDYRDELAALIREKFKTQRAFCKATGLSEDLISHVLAGRKHLAMDTLSEALEKIGYKLWIKPALEKTT